MLPSFSRKKQHRNHPHSSHRGKSPPEARHRSVCGRFPRGLHDPETLSPAQENMPTAAEFLIRRKIRDPSPLLNLDLGAIAVSAFIYLENILKSLRSPSCVPADTACRSPAVHMDAPSSVLIQEQCTHRSHPSSGPEGSGPSITFSLIFSFSRSSAPSPRNLAISKTSQGSSTMTGFIRQQSSSRHSHSC